MIAPRDIGATFRRTWLLARIAFLDVVLVPALAWLALQVVEVQDDLAVGILLVAIASAGPVGMKVSQIARGDIALAISLVVVLEAVNAVAIPIWVAVLMPEGVEVPLGPVVTTLTALIVLPLTVGGVARARMPALATTWVPRLTRLSDAGIVVVIAIIVARNADRLFDAFGTGVGFVSLGLAGVCAALGWALGGPYLASRRSASLVTTVRASGPALAIAVAAFADRPGVAIAIVVYGTIAIVVSLTLAFFWSRRNPTDRQPSPNKQQGSRPAG